MKKKLIIILALICVILVAFTACTSQGTNTELIKNGGFENYEDETMQNWSYYKNSTSSANVEVVYEVNDGQTIENVDNRYTVFNISGGYSTVYLKQQVKLQKGKTYKLSASFNIPSAIKGESNKKDYFGAYIGFLEDSNFKDLVINKATQGWIRRDVYFKADTTDTYTFVVGIGSETHGGGQGKVSIDNVSLTKVNDVPAGFSTGIVSSKNISSSTTSGIIYTVIFAFLTAIILYLAYIMIRKSLYKDTLEKANSKGKFFTSTSMMFIYVILSAFLIRFLFFMLFDGMASVLTSMGKIAIAIGDNGIFKLFEFSTTTQPFGMIYLLGAIGGLANATELVADSVGMAMLIRIPFIIADLVTCYMIYSMVHKHYNQIISAVVAGLFALLPMMFTATSIWGMTVSITIMFIVATLYCMIEKKHIGVGIFYALALLFDYYALILAPVMLLYAIYYIIKDKSSRVKIISTAIACVIGLYLITLPLAFDYVAKGKVFFVLEKMFAEFAANVRMSNSAFNLYAIFGMSTGVANAFSKVITAFVMCAFISGGVFMFLKSNNRLNFILLSALCMLTYATFGVGANIEMLILGVVLLLLYAGISGDSRIYKIFGVLSILVFINICLVLINSGYLTMNVLENAGFSALHKFDAGLIIGSILSVITLIYLYYVSYKVMVIEDDKPITPLVMSIKEDFKMNYNNLKNSISNTFNKFLKK